MKIKWTDFKCKTMVSVARLKNWDFINQKVTRSEVKLKFMGLQGSHFCRILVLGPHFWGLLCGGPSLGFAPEKEGFKVLPITGCAICHLYFSSLNWFLTRLVGYLSSQFPLSCDWTILTRFALRMKTIYEALVASVLCETVRANFLSGGQYHIDFLLYTVQGLHTIPK